MVHKNTDISLVFKASRVEAPNYRSLVFERPVGFGFDAGDWVDIIDPQQELTGGKTFSLASSPTETDLMITLKEGLSPFKRHLQSLRSGEVLKIIQYGNDYGFQIGRNSSNVLIAGGVGVAPFRSMLKEMSDIGSQSSVRLIFLNKDADYLFRTELDGWARQLAGVSIEYIVTAGLSRKKREKRLQEALPADAGHFYVAGPVGMVTSTKKMLIGQGADERNIKVDSFGGYD